MRRTLVAALLLAVASGAAPNSRKQAPPGLMLWSWYAQDDFRPLADRDLGVAFLALSLRFEGQSQVTPSPRAEPVRISPTTYQMVVVRFDYQTYGSRPAAFSPRQRQLAVRMVLEMAALARPQAVQIDFDAPPSAWPFYRELLADLRDRLGPDIFLSVTALVSWCDTAQSWMAHLPVDEIVPMAFSMGQATPAIFTLLQRGGQFAFPGCRASIGVRLSSGYESGVLVSAQIRPHKTQRAYFFPAAERWSPGKIAKARKAVLP